MFGIFLMCDLFSFSIDQLDLFYSNVYHDTPTWRKNCPSIFVSWVFDKYLMIITNRYRIHIIILFQCTGIHFMVLNNAYKGNIVDVGLFHDNNSFVQNVKAKIKEIILNCNILVICIAIKLRFYILIHFQPLKFRITDSKIKDVIIHSEI